MAPEQKHRLVIAEDHTILREGLKALLAARPELEVVGEATDGRDAIRCAEELMPDLMLLDLSMPRSNGLEALKEIKRLSPNTKVLVLTVHKTEDYVFTALQNGADGYVLKDSSSSELIMAVRSVLNGERYLSPGGMMPKPQIIAERAKPAGLTSTCVEPFGQSYARTLAIWRQRFLVVWPAVAAQGFDERFCRMWEYYLAYCEGGFRNGTIDVGLYRLQKPESAAA